MTLISFSCKPVIGFFEYRTLITRALNNYIYVVLDLFQTVTFFRFLKSNRNFAHINLVLSLFLAELLFVVGTEKTQYKVLNFTTVLVCHSLLFFIRLQHGQMYNQVFDFLCSWHDHSSRRLSFNFVFIFFRTNRPESMKVIVANCSLIFAAFFVSRLAALSLPYCFIIYFLFHFAGWQQKEWFFMSCLLKFSQHQVRVQGKDYSSYAHGVSQAFV